MPVTNVNDFFSFSGPPPLSVPPPSAVVSIKPNHLSIVGRSKVASFFFLPPFFCNQSHSSFAGSVGPYPLSPSVSSYQAPHSQAPTPAPVSIPSSLPSSAPAPVAVAAALPSPAISHPLPPSPISTHPRERSESKQEVSVGDTHPEPENAGMAMTAAAHKGEDAKLSQPLSTEAVPLTPEDEPTPPDPSKMVLHHNGKIN